MTKKEYIENQFKEAMIYACDVNKTMNELENMCMTIFKNNAKYDRQDLIFSLRSVYTSIQAVKRYQDPINKILKAKSLK